MAFVMIMQWEGVSLEQYEAARRAVDWEQDLPVGALFHVAAHDGTSLRVTDVWQSPEQFQAFVDTRLMPATQKLGITHPPKVEVLPAHAIFAPGYNPK